FSTNCRYRRKRRSFRVPKTFFNNPNIFFPNGHYCIVGIMQTPYRDIPKAMDACEGSPLHYIIKKAQFLSALDHYTQTILPDTLKSFCQVMNVQNGVLILGVSNAAAA